jgi:restriction system protein
MSNVKIPTSAELERAILNIFEPPIESLTNEQILERIVVLLKISDEVKAIKHSGSRTELDYRLAWARTKLSKRNQITRISPKTWKIVK